MRVLIIGAGDVGFYLAKSLAREQHDIVIVEADPHKVARAIEQIDATVIEGNGASFRILQQANLDEIQVVAAVTDSDEANLMACRLLKKYGIQTTIARVRHPQFTETDFLLSPEDLGTDLILHPEKETADAIVDLIRKSSATHAIYLEGGKIELLGMRLQEESSLFNIPLKYLGKETDDLHLRIVAINRNYRTIIPKGDDMLKPGDQIFVLCDHDFSKTFTTLMGRQDKPAKNIMILGGGLIARFVAEALGKEANVKIIEKDLNKARRLADVLPHALIIHGDGTDFDLLHHEDLSEMDAFVAVTGNDEVNIITTLLAQHSDVGRSIALINKSEYLQVSSKIGMDAVVSKQSLAVDSIRRFIHSEEVAYIAALPGIEAQLIEYVVGQTCPITAGELRNVTFPNDAIIGLVMRDDEVFIPHGNTHIQADDKVSVFALRETIAELDKLFHRTMSKSKMSRFLKL